MSHEHDRGYVDPPFDELCRAYPSADVYPARDFRLEWGPIFHRGRLDGTARVLVLGQDPGQHEAIARRILVGVAGQRVQGFLSRLGIESSYVMMNAFMYSVYGQPAANRNRDNPGIIAYRHLWFDALLANTGVEAVIAFGNLADEAYRRWKATPTGAATNLAYGRITHPTQPEASSGGDPVKRAAAMKRMLSGWNRTLRALAPAIQHPDVERDLIPYGTDLLPEDLSPIPERDLPAGLPAWMRSLEPWAIRSGATSAEKRATVVVTVPMAHRTWKSPSG